MQDDRDRLLDAALTHVPFEGMNDRALIAGARDVVVAISNTGTTREVVQEIVGLPIDYTTVVDLSGFTKLVDAMGGVTIDVLRGVELAVAPGEIAKRPPARSTSVNCAGASTVPAPTSASGTSRAIASIAASATAPAPSARLWVSCQ